MMRDAWMQVLPPREHCFNSRSSSSSSSSSSTKNWTREDNKLFEKALALFDGDGPERWQRVADEIPGKTVWEVMAHYRHLEADVTRIEAGLLPFSFDFNYYYFSGSDGNGNGNIGKRSPANAKSTWDQERKKGVPWTQEEHRLFLRGLEEFGKGEWRSIARNFVLTRTPTQVASHAQKYFIRLNSPNKDKRRPSIHDINLSDVPC